MHVKQMLDATLVNAHINLTEDKCVIIIGLKYTQHHILFYCFGESMVALGCAEA